jgi:hypothetical protein
MPDHPPLACSAPREPTKRSRPIPPAIKTAIKLMVRGKDDDPDTKPLNLIDAARAAGVQAFILRRYLDRPAVVALLRSQRRAFRNELCATNEACLADIRANAANSMAKLGAIRTLEELSDAEYTTHRRSEPASPWITINITSPPASPSAPQMKVVEHLPAEPELESGERRDAFGHRVDENGQWCFDPDYDRQ